MKWASWISFVLGLWLIVTPFVMPSSAGAAPNDVILGILIATFSLWMAALYEPPALVSWLVAFFGAWMVIAALVLRNSGQPSTAVANELIVGAVVCILALLRALGVGRMTRTRG